jgi:MerR family transcriptional regulator, redox-sensitive transcriptional activator SoxR
LPQLTIGQVADRAGIRTSHIRFYERVGVLPQPERVGGQRRYDEDVVHRLSIIDVAQRAGFSLDEIKRLIRPDTHVADAGERMRALVEGKLPAIDALIARGQAVRRWLEVASACECSTVDVCSLFVDPALSPPPAAVGLDLHVGAHARCATA